jgi:hypothetical protein
MEVLEPSLPAATRSRAALITSCRMEQEHGVEHKLRSQEELEWEIG